MVTLIVAGTTLVLSLFGITITFLNNGRAMVTSLWAWMGLAPSDRSDGTSNAV